MYKRFWLILAVTILTDVTVLKISEFSVFIPLRWVISLIFSLVLPGYCLLEALFSPNEIDLVVKACLSVILSFCLLALVGLLINYLFGNITLLNLMIFISFEIIILATIGGLKHSRFQATRNIIVD